MPDAMRLSCTIPILAGAALIAGSILFTNRWEISGAANNDNPYSVYRLDRWTGTIEYCDADMAKLKENLGSEDNVAIKCPSPP
jgi:hypothetical protein